MHFCIVTPCLEPCLSLFRTMHSVFAQTVLASSRHTVSYVLQMKDEKPFEIDSPSLPSLSVELRQGPDSGLYDALASAFEEDNRADVFCYLGAGDWLAPTALEIVSEVMAKGAEWVTGLICGYNDRGHLIEVQTPFRYRRRLIQIGAYGSVLPFIQQESTFWNARLHALLDWPRIRTMRYAGDALLWHTFAQSAELVVVEAWLGGFEKRIGQLSREFAEDYQLELRSVSKRASLRDRAQSALDWIVWRCPRSVKRTFDKSRFVYAERSGEFTRYTGTVCR